MKFSLKSLENTIKEQLNKKPDLNQHLNPVFIFIKPNKSSGQLFF